MGYLYLLPFYIIGILKLLFFVLYACRETDEYGCILFYHSSLYIGSKLFVILFDKHDKFWWRYML